MSTLLAFYQALSLSKKLGLATLVVGALILSTTATLRGIFLEQQHQQQNLQLLELISISLVAQIKDEINQGKQAELKTLLKSALNTLPITLISIKSRDPGTRFPSIQLQKNTYNSKTAIEYIYRIHTEKGVFNLIFHTDEQQLANEFWRHQSLNWLVDFFGYSLLCLTLYIFTQKNLVNRLLMLHKTTRRLELDTPSDLAMQGAQDNKQDEFSDILESFNRVRRAFIDDLDQRQAIELALISEKKEKLATRRLIQEAEAASRAKNHFIATMSHEIRTPMNGVIGMVEMLRETPLNDSQRHYIEVIYRSGESLLNIIDDILDYSKIEAGKMDLEKVAFDIVDLVEDCLQLFSADTRKRGIEFVGCVEPDTPQKLIGDPTRLKQVIVNLIGNAFKFTSQGHVLLHIKPDDSCRSKTTRLCFSIQDSGIGVEESVKKHLFDAFGQADISTTRRFGGTGLGLAICKQLVELMDGEIAMDSQAGKGSDFWFSIPFKLADEDASRRGLSRSLALSEKRLHLSHSSTFFGDLLSRYAAHWNLHCEQSKTAAETLQKIKRSPDHCDFFVVSEALNGNEGLALASAIREMPHHRHTPILLVTHEPQSELNHKHLNPISSVVTRPLTLHQLLEKLMQQAAGAGPKPLIPEAEKPSGERKAAIEVLVAEDNPINQMVIEGLLSRFNIDPKFAENGLEALDSMSDVNASFDVIFMDCEMPQMDGFEAALKIRQLEMNTSRSPIPIIALTAHVEAEHRRRAFSSGMNYYLSKPVTLEKLKQSLVSVGLM